MLSNLLRAWYHTQDHILFLFGVHWVQLQGQVCVQCFNLETKFHPSSTSHPFNASPACSTVGPTFLWLLHVWPLWHNNLAKRLQFAFRYHPLFVLKWWALAYFSLNLFSFRSLWQKMEILAVKINLDIRSKFSLAFQDTLF